MLDCIDTGEGLYDDLHCEGGEVARLPAPVDQVGDQHPVQGHRVHQEVGGLHQQHHYHHHHYEH